MSESSECIVSECACARMQEDTRQAGGQAGGTAGLRMGLTAAN